MLFSLHGKPLMQAHLHIRRDNDKLMKCNQCPSWSDQSHLFGHKRSHNPKIQMSGLYFLFKNNTFTVGFIHNSHLWVGFYPSE